MAAIDVTIRAVNETYLYIDTHKGILREMREVFSFFPASYKFDKRYKMGIWDGKISLLNVSTQRIYKGLLPDIITFCETNGYEFVLEEEVLSSIPEHDITDAQAAKFFKTINGPYEPYAEQAEGLRICINEGRAVILASTSFGKSYLIHAIASFHALQRKKVLVVIDSSHLTRQLKKNMIDYGAESYMTVNSIYDEVEIGDVDVLTTTWQSIVDYPQSWFDQFDVLIADEVHKFKAASLKKIVDKCGHIANRYGFTATMDNDSKVDRLTIIGMFGVPHRIMTAKQSVEKGIASKPIIHAITLNYPKEFVKEVNVTVFSKRLKRKIYGLEFPVENQKIMFYEPRTEFIKKLTKNLGGNILIIFKDAEYGHMLADSIKEDPPEGCEAVFFANGEVSSKKRIAMAEKVDTMKCSVGVVSLKTFGTGVSINNINHIIIACQIKSEIDVPQVLGRGMRKDEITGKDSVDIWDIGDNACNSKRENHLWKHFLKRLEIYGNEGHTIKMHEYTLK